MGSGDEILATGLARGFHARGKLAAFGDGHRIIWGPWCAEMFKGNPNIAPPGSEGRSDLEYVHHYKGCRKYNKLVNGRWQWNMDFKAKPGEFYFNEAEKVTIEQAKVFRDFIVVEPNVEWQKSVAPNKDWGEANYNELVWRLVGEGHRVLQFIHKNSRRRLRGVATMETKFRHAIATLSLAKLYIGPEGGMHHAAAAVDVPAVVLMGGFIPPSVVGYDGHINLTGGAEACGTISQCEHCRQAMAKITVEEVWGSAMQCLPVL